LVNYLVVEVLPSHTSKHQLDKLKADAKYYVWEEPYLWKFCSNGVIRRCVPDREILFILKGSQDIVIDGHFGPTRTA